ncbi:hypothetical protein OS493_035526 [Desmophyllum pertusum]|uniref:Uncharacterized protein n=1 Tax=Desmophyllum pertusum TaxID=174260 RepID=A0A9X0CI08_9CNID|nr:hypothetical protein OS493_035526 [Desmophyllum pertusum]
MIVMHVHIRTGDIHDSVGILFSEIPVDDLNSEGAIRTNALARAACVRVSLMLLLKCLQHLRLEDYNPDFTNGVETSAKVAKSLKYQTG